MRGLGKTEHPAKNTKAVLFAKKGSSEHPEADLCGMGGALPPKTLPLRGQMSEEKVMRRRRQKTKAESGEALLTAQIVSCVQLAARDTGSSGGRQQVAAALSLRFVQD